MNEGETEESKQNQMIEEGGRRAGNRRDPKEDPVSFSQPSPKMLNSQT
ncbi:hypothetical protein SLEP1_g46885 [Rubroshorea leprosula]|uniref:Uncharacterized protein n=1 Tax=Rubroshorea leprosula TaxID=152421 RepID=A0AAV5LPL2_9ROSI|nr:hypothetical protein SLEP1_g46885 [Rubroshorea leprosula]